MRQRYEVQGISNDPTEDTNFYSRHKHRSNSIHVVPIYAAATLVIALFGLFGIMYLIDGILPTALTVADEKDYPDSFITERAQHDLKMLTEIGPRVTGSYENEALAVDFLKREITHIHNQAHSNQKIEMDIQTVSGSYLLEFKPHGGVNAYGNVQNVIVKLHSKNNSRHSLLVNAHFDSVPTSPGGSDDGINCAVMLEVLRKLSKSPERLEHNVIFLFNGAEETPLHASHGFITQHKWAKEARVVVNLEAGGAGNKEILFQLGPGQPWLLKYYQKVPHPNGQAAGEELFQTGLIPSDTDFRIFRDFGNIIGMDMAFARNGYRYHTKYDDYANIPPGSYQHVGDNVLSLVRGLGNAPELSNSKGQPVENTIYFDFLGLFMFSYTATVAMIINILTVIASFVVGFKAFYNFGLKPSWQSMLHLAVTVGAVFLGWVLAAIVVIVIGFIVDYTGFSLSWYGNPWIILGLYVIPTVVCFAGAVWMLNNYCYKDNWSISIQTQIQAHVIRIIWSIPLLIGTLWGLRVVYVILLPVMFHTLTCFVIQLFKLEYSVRKWQIVYVIGTIIPSMFLMSQAINIFSILIPICGRMGSDRNPELYIGVLALVLTITVTSFYVCLITLVDRPNLLLAALTGVFLLFFIIVFTPLGFPYSGNPNAPAPQRHWIFVSTDTFTVSEMEVQVQVLIGQYLSPASTSQSHTSRTFKNDTNHVTKKDAGFFVLNLDRNSPHKVKNYVKDFGKMKSIADDCKISLFCGLPISSYRMIQILDKSTWIPAEQPIIHTPIKLQLNSKSVLGNDVTRFNFSLSGPDRMVIYISSKPNVNLTKISLIDELPERPIMWNGRPTYGIMYVWGQETPLTFYLDFLTSTNWNSTFVDIGVAGLYVHDRTTIKTPHYLQFINEFPDWADVTAWVANYEEWIY